MPFIVQQAPPEVYLHRTKIELVESKTEESKNPNRDDILKLDGDVIQYSLRKTKYLSLKQAWINNTEYSSSLSEITEDINFKRIVAMGRSVLPLIMEDLEKKPSHLVWAVNLITKTTLRPRIRMTITDACKSWVKIYKRQPALFSGND